MIPDYVRRKKDMMIKETNEMKEFWYASEEYNG